MATVHLITRKSTVKGRLSLLAFGTGKARLAYFVLEFRPIALNVCRQLMVVLVKLCCGSAERRCVVH